MIIARRNRRSLRLSNFNYSNGCYFVTICTFNRFCLFGEYVNGDVSLNEFGLQAQIFLLEILIHFPDVMLDEFVVMPNHIHVILKLQNLNKLKNLENKFQKIIPRSLGVIIRGYKIAMTKFIREVNGSCQVWQRNYYEKIINNQKDLLTYRRYIINNSKNWEKDCFYYSENKRIN